MGLITAKRRPRLAFPRVRASPEDRRTEAAPTLSSTPRSKQEHREIAGGAGGAGQPAGLTDNVSLKVVAPAYRAARGTGTWGGLARTVRARGGGALARSSPRSTPRKSEPEIATCAASGRAGAPVNGEWVLRPGRARRHRDLGLGWSQVAAKQETRSGRPWRARLSPAALS